MRNILVGRARGAVGRHAMRSLCGALVAILATSTMARAASITYDFTATASGGPLAGDVFPGVFTVDSASVAAGFGNVDLISFDVLGTTLTGSEGLFGLIPSATFDSSGNLTSLNNFVVVSPARAAAEFLSGGVPLPSPISSLSFGSQHFNYGTDPAQGELNTGGTFAGDPAPVSVSEPAGLALFGAGLLGLGLTARRRRARSNVARGEHGMLGWIAAIERP